MPMFAPAHPGELITDAEFWLRAQDNYDLAIARKKVDTTSITVFWKPAA